MKTLVLYVTLVLAIAALFVGGFALVKPVSTTQQPLGSATGPNFLSQVSFWAGDVHKGQIATTSNTTAEIITANEFNGWANSSEVSFTPIATAAATLTFPASSTVAATVPSAGDSQSFCFRNATSTAGIYLTFAGSTGINLLAASSSVSAVGSKVVMSGKVACFKLTREAKTSTTFDIDALMTTFN